MAHLGIDLGGTYARAALVGDDGRLQRSVKVALTTREPADVADAVARAADDVVAGATGITHCGVGVAGMLDLATGTVVNAPNLRWRQVPFARMLAERLGRPVRLVNDVAAAAWGEFRVGAGAGVDDVLVVFVGSGVGGAVISGGRLVRGTSGVAGEIGHVKVVVDGRPCGCGMRGCVEAYIGGHNLLAQMREAIAADTPTLLRERSRGEDAALTPVLLEEAALSGDAVARAIYDAAARHLAVAIANQVIVLNPARLILGGGVLRRCPALREAVATGVHRYATDVVRHPLTIVDAALGDDSGLIGAALLADSAA